MVRITLQAHNHQVSFSLDDKNIEAFLESWSKQERVIYKYANRRGVGYDLSLYSGFDMKPDEEA